MGVKQILIFIMLGYMVVAEEPSLSDVPESEVPKLLDNLPKELQGQIDQVYLVDQLMNTTGTDIKKNCELNGGPDAYNNSDAASKKFVSDVESLFNTSKIYKEIEDAKPEGKLDEVFKKYCDLTPKFISSLNSFMETVKVCYNEVEREKLSLITNVTEQLIDFVCFKDGERIAMFFAEDGPKCLETKSDDMLNCVNNTLWAKKFSNNIMTHPADITFEEKDCSDLNIIEHCVVKELEKCPKPTTANIMASLFKFLRQSTPCKDVMITKHEKHSHNMLEDAKPNLDVQVVAGSATGLTVTTLMIISAIFTTFLM